MRTISRSGSGLLLGLALVLGLPALASAQLFPDLPIRRQRPDSRPHSLWQRALAVLREAASYIAWGLHIPA